MGNLKIYTPAMFEQCFSNAEENEQKKMFYCLREECQRQTCLKEINTAFGYS